MPLHKLAPFVRRGRGDFERNGDLSTTMRAPMPGNLLHRGDRGKWEMIVYAIANIALTVS